MLASTRLGQARVGGPATGGGGGGRGGGAGVGAVGLWLHAAESASARTAATAAVQVVAQFEKPAPALLKHTPTMTELLILSQECRPAKPRVGQEPVDPAVALNMLQP